MFALTNIKVSAYIFQLVFQNYQFLAICGELILQLDMQMVLKVTLETPTVIFPFLNETDVHEYFIAEVFLARGFEIGRLLMFSMVTCDVDCGM